MSFTTQLLQEFQSVCCVMFGEIRKPMLRCGATTRRKTVDSCRPGTAMLDIEPLVKLLRILVVFVSLCNTFVLFLAVNISATIIVRRFCLRIYLVRSARTVPRCELV